jgi:catechol 2,3-dioxygenase-like lactoylglutathione lyase family enzyme
MAMSLHHVQVSGPAGCEDAMRSFYGGVLGMTELEKPERLRRRGGAWFRSGSLEIHVGIEEGFRPARKAHPGIAVDDVDALAERVAASGAPVEWDDAIPGVRRFHTSDPMGNRLEFQQAERGVGRPG